MARSGYGAKSAGINGRLSIVPDTGRPDPGARFIDPRETTMKALDAETIQRQFAFLAELDRLKSVIRQSPLINRTRKEKLGGTLLASRDVRACARSARRGGGTP